MNHVHLRVYWFSSDTDVMFMLWLRSQRVPEQPSASTLLITSYVGVMKKNECHSLVLYLGFLPKKLYMKKKRSEIPRKKNLLRLMHFIICRFYCFSLQAAV